MKKVYLFVFASLIFATCISAQTVIPPEGIESITAQEMYDHVAFLASDEMQGRDTPSPELNKAAEYIAADFNQNGLLPISENGSYFQPFNTQRMKLDTPNTLSVSINGEEIDFRIKNDFVPLHLSGNKAAEAPLTFVGYGIEAPEYGYNDYANIDVKGKIVLVLSNEPQQKDSTSVFDGVKNTDYSKLYVKVETAIQHGAVGLLYIRNPNNNIGRRPPNKWPSLMRTKPENYKVPLTLEQPQDQKLVAMAIGKKVADTLMGGSNTTLSDLQTLIDNDLTPQSRELSGVTVKMNVSLAAEILPTQNVVCYIQGTDLKDEFVVIGAHYDHVGVNNGEVYNGADDNASGSAGVMEIAEAFASCGQKPRRSVVFITFAGEEKGLFGSRFYADNPVFSTQNTVAMLNMDMISRNDSNEVAIIGWRTSEDLKIINEKQNEAIEMKLAYDQERYFRQSDHYPFYTKNIPVLFYNTKNHEDLHKPTDDIEKIIPEKMAKIGKLVFSTAWNIANADTRPTFTPIK